MAAFLAELLFFYSMKKKHIRNPVWEDTQLRETDILLDMFSESVLNISKPWAINTVLWGNRITTLLERFGVRQLTLISEKPLSVKGIYLQPQQYNIHHVAQLSLTWAFGQETIY